MGTWGRVAGWSGVGIVVAGITVFLTSQGLDRANQWSGVLSLFLGLAGLVLSVLGFSRAKAGAQTVDGASAGGSIRAVRGVKGDVVIRSAAPTRPAPAAGPVPTTAPEPGAQSARGARAGKEIDLIDGVEGSVRLDETP
ncbi:hypothetical protein ABT095_12935 [Kitasatospora sp. NPDC002227]|uniref:hypothetical protein n=1 Tax=Kitasatospora sp. NPDC002227 TaxID=3154773 RepID=UPI00331D4DFD